MAERKKIRKPKTLKIRDSFYHIETVDFELGVDGPIICTSNTTEMRRIGKWLLKVADWKDQKYGRTV